MWFIESALVAASLTNYTGDATAFGSVVTGHDMLIGIVSDIHDAIVPLRNALARFRELGVERVVTLGDAFDTYKPGEPAGDVARALCEAGAVGVWGNHDVGLSHEVSDGVRLGADPDLLGFASRLAPQLVVENCRFSHVEHWLDPHKIEDLWFFDALDSLERANRSFNAVTERFLFMGHYHYWLVADSNGMIARGVAQPMVLRPADRYLVVADAVQNGWCATFDSTTAELTPIRCGLTPSI